MATGPADRVLIYLIMFIRECIVKSQKCPNAAEARKTLNTFALSNFSIPGDSKFPLNNLYPAPATRQDGGVLKPMADVVYLGCQLSQQRHRLSWNLSEYCGCKYLETQGKCRS